MAKLIVRGSLQTKPGEKVIIHADPTYFSELLEQVRIEIVKRSEEHTSELQSH